MDDEKEVDVLVVRSYNEVMNNHLFSILGGISLLLLAVGMFLINILANHNRKQKKPIRELATLIHKETYDVAIQGKHGVGSYTSFEVTFKLSNGERTFVVNALFYNRLKIGNKAMLTYTKYGDFISFGDYIKETPDDSLPSRI